MEFEIPALDHGRSFRGDANPLDDPREALPERGSATWHPINTVPAGIILQVGSASCGTRHREVPSRAAVKRSETIDHRSVCGGTGMAVDVFSVASQEHPVMKLILAAPLFASSLFLAVPASAQGTASTPGMVPGAAASAPAAKPTGSKADRTARSKECSAEADKKGLHGKARKAFRNTCKHGQS